MALAPVAYALLHLTGVKAVIQYEAHLSRQLTGMLHEYEALLGLVAHAQCPGDALALEVPTEAASA